MDIATITLIIFAIAIIVFAIVFIQPHKTPDSVWWWRRPSRRLIICYTGVMRFRKSNHAIYKTEYHVVWTPRYRRRIFTHGVQQYAFKLLKHLDTLDPDIEVIKLNVQPDHIHMVIVIPPRVSVAEVVQFIKSQSGSELKQKFPFLQKMFWGREGIWAQWKGNSCVCWTSRQGWRGATETQPLARA